MRSWGGSRDHGIEGNVDDVNMYFCKSHKCCKKRWPEKIIIQTWKVRKELCPVGRKGMTCALVGRKGKRCALVGR